MSVLVEERSAPVRSAAGGSQPRSAPARTHPQAVLGLIVTGALACIALWWTNTPSLSGLGDWLTNAGRITGLLAGYGVGLLGLVAIKVLAPGYYASQDIRTPVRIAMAVLVITQLLNVVLVPWIEHAGLALSIGLAALVNALWLLMGLLRRGSYRPQPGWARFALQVVAASVLMAMLLVWATQYFDWIALRAHGARRAALLAGVLAAAMAVYFGALWAAGLKLRQLLRR